MSEQLTAEDFNTSVVPSRLSRVETYLWDAGDEVSAEIAADLYRPEKPLQRTCVLIPVAAHQEAGSIATAMETYASQNALGPFTILMLLNYPKGSDTEAVSRTITELSLASGRHPQLDVRYSLRSYEKPVIGQLRKDLWDATARIALQEGTFEGGLGDVIGINHDIDTLGMSPRYIRNIQAHYIAHQMLLREEGLESAVLEPRFTAVRHAYPFESHPNVAKALFWTDFAYRQSHRDGCYEEGLVIPFSAYAKHGGMDASARTHETRRFRPPSDAGIPGTPMVTSPRRYIARLSEDSTGPIWQDETFTANDTFRTDIKSIPDITFEQAEDRILDQLPENMYGIAWGRSNGKLVNVFSRYVTDVVCGRQLTLADRAEISSVAGREISHRLFLAKSVLRRVVGSEPLAGLVDDIAKDLRNEFVTDFFEMVYEEVRDVYGMKVDVADEVSARLTETCTSGSNLLN